MRLSTWQPLPAGVLSPLVMHISGVLYALTVRLEYIIGRVEGQRRLQLEFGVTRWSYSGGG